MIIYISGRYPLLNESVTKRSGFDIRTLNRELADEAKWMAIIRDCGLGWIGPLNNLASPEGKLFPKIRTCLRINLSLLDRLSDGVDGILIRPGANVIRATGPRPFWYQDGEIEGCHCCLAEQSLATAKNLVRIETLEGEETAKEYLEVLAKSGEIK